MRLDGLLFEACAAFGPAVALENANSAVTFTELAATARAWAGDLRDLPLNADEPVLVAIANEPFDIVAFLAVWFAGGVVVPVSRAAPAAAVEATRAATGARYMVGEKGKITKLSATPPPARDMLKDAALIIFTSGSTGAPKGVVLGHNALAGKLLEIDSILQFSRETRALLILQIIFIFGIWFTLCTLLKGGRVFMCERFDPATLIADLVERRITDAAFVPTMLRKLLMTEAAVKSPALKRVELKRIHTGGEPFSTGLGERLREVFPRAGVVDIYGLTETGSSNFFLATAPNESFVGGIGRVSKSERFRIADAQNRELPKGEIGELQIATPLMMNGYLDRPDLTQAARAGDYFRTGDIARLRDDGIVELAGRNKDLISRAGAKIAPLELDHLIAQHPAVAAALTVGVPDEITGERVHVLVVPQRKIGEAELRQWVSERLERFKWPDAYHFGDELPLGRTGKVDRGALRQSIVQHGGWKP